MNYINVPLSEKNWTLLGPCLKEPGQEMLWEVKKWKVNMVDGACK